MGSGQNQNGSNATILIPVVGILAGIAAGAYFHSAIVFIVVALLGFVLYLLVEKKVNGD